MDFFFFLLLQVKLGLPRLEAWIALSKIRKMY
jgi:hypothetical protein